MSTTREYIEATIQSVVQIFGVSRPGKKRRRSSHLNVPRRAFVERLEERTLLTVVFPLLQYGSETDAPGRSNIGLQNPTVNLIFAGNWTNYQQDETNMIAAAQSILSGPYLSGLAQYTTSGTATFGTYWNDPNNAPGATLPSAPTNGQLQAFIQHSIATYGSDPGNHDIEHAPNPVRHDSCILYNSIILRLR
ncbi:MAG: hypothetical protein ABSH08_06755 [Tepidisphaeraceae bacterium]